MRVTPEQRRAWLEHTASSPFNRWLDALVRGPDGSLDLQRLHAVARRYGVDREGQYAHLNAGQQRMNIGNALRRVVPPSDYSDGGATPPLSQAAPTIPAEPRPPAERPPVITAASIRELLLMHGQIMDELRERKVVRTGNAPVGDYAELLFARAFDWLLEGSSSAGHDATDGSGQRYQVKSRRITARNPSRQLSAIRRLPERTFDFLAGVLFDEVYAVSRAAIIPHAVVRARAKRVEHTNSWRFLLEDKVWEAEGVRDVTADLVRAESDLPPSLAEVPAAASGA